MAGLTRPTRCERAFATRPTFGGVANGVCCLMVVVPHNSWIDAQRERLMRTKVTALLATGALVGFAGSVFAHHSFAMFDQEHPIQLSGTVKEFRYTSPHTFIILDVKDKDGTNQLWNLEGGAPSGLIRDGWSSKTLKPGDELQLSVDPLRSGAPGGSWNVNKIKYKDGNPIVVTH